jgi:hypothetical protein
MTCSYCAARFDEERSKEGCAGCSFVGGGCRKVRCPRCGFEMPEPLKLPKFLDTWRRHLGR